MGVGGGFGGDFLVLENGFEAAKKTCFQIHQKKSHI